MRSLNSEYLCTDTLYGRDLLSSSTPLCSLSIYVPIKDGAGMDGGPFLFAQVWSGAGSQGLYFIFKMDQKYYFYIDGLIRTLVFEPKNILYFCSY